MKRCGFTHSATAVTAAYNIVLSWETLAVSLQNRLSTVYKRLFWFVFYEGLKKGQEIVMKSLKPRLLTAVIGIPAVIIIMLLSELWLPLLRIIVGLASVLMVGEYLSAKGLIGCSPLTAVCMLYTMLMPLVIINSPLAYMVTYLFLLAGFVVSLIYYRKLHFFNLAYAMFGTLLITFGMSAVSIACTTNGVSVSFFFVLIFLLPWMADGGGYFVGSYLGHRKLCPNISPKKTVEGVLGGAVFCVASAMIMGLIFQFAVFRGDENIHVNFAALVVLAILDSVVSLIGDLSFSLIKRVCKIKDYGSIFPGHGGMLDRCDSIIFTAPLVVALGQIMPFLQILV